MHARQQPQPQPQQNSTITIKAKQNKKKIKLKNKNKKTKPKIFKSAILKIDYYFYPFYHHLFQKNNHFIQIYYSG